MSQWVVLLRGSPGEIAAAQSWLNANEIPNIVRSAEVHGVAEELLVPVEKVSLAKQLLSAMHHLQHECGCGDRGDWDE